MRKLICKDITCKYNGSNNVCEKKTVEIDFGSCQSYEKGFHYYLQLIYGKLRSTNMIPLHEVNEEVQIGLYYVMEIFDLGFSQCEHGAWRWVMLKDGESGKGLMTKEIVAREVNVEKLMKHINDFNNGILPNQNQEKEEPKKTSQPFGWLSPTGDFTEGDWGEHETVAYNIIKEKRFYEEYKKNSIVDTARDFLSEVKGYVLIHNPGGFGGYIVSHVKPLTKKQKEFLYGYFMDIGDSWKAEQYLDD